MSRARRSYWFDDQDLTEQDIAPSLPVPTDPWDNLAEQAVIQACEGWSLDPEALDRLRELREAYRAPETCAIHDTPVNELGVCEECLAEPDEAWGE